MILTCDSCHQKVKFDLQPGDVPQTVYYAWDEHRVMVVDANGQPGIRREIKE